MPPIKWIKPPKNVPPPNMVRDLFNRYQKAQGMTSADLGRQLGMSPEAVRSKKSRGTWTTDDVRDWCHALGITSAEEVGKAILYK